MKCLYFLKIFLYFIAHFACKYWRKLWGEESPHNHNQNYLCARGHALKSAGEICTLPVLRTGPCGHSALRPCDSPQEEDWKCEQIVQKKREQCGHFVTTPCGQSVDRPCMVLCNKRLQCGHKSRGLFPCSQSLDAAAPEACLYRRSETLACGHDIYIACGDKLVDRKCKKRLQKKFPNCLHEITQDCFEEVSQEICIACADEKKLSSKSHRLDMTRTCTHGIVFADTPERPNCMEKCWERLECNHLCQRKCHSDDKHECFKPCSRRCPRGHPCSKAHNCSSPCPPCTSFETIYYEFCTHKEIISCSEIRGKNPVCEYVCKSEMSCGHDCGKVCCDHVEGKCPPCLEVSHSSLLPCRHTCRAPCADHSEDSKGQLVCPPCEHGLKTCKYGHTSNVGCETTNVEEKCMAETSIEVELACGKSQSLNIYCRDRNDILIESKSVENHSRYCFGPCGVVFNHNGESCGHVCPGMCSDCYTQLIHERCSEPCGKALPCFHLCARPCCDMCGPCESSCENECEHRKCEESCGTPCLACQEPCTYQCKHLKCNRLCHQMCDREPCTVPCPKLLNCQHPCLGYCGEVCPSLCRVCDRKRIEYELKRRILPTDRFIRLRCGHDIYEATLDETLRNPRTNNVCPTCAKVIYNCKRYSAIIRKSSLEIMRAKIKLYGTQKSIKESQLRAWDYLQPQHKLNNKLFIQLEPFRRYVRRMLATQDFSYSNPSVSLNKMCLMEAESLEFLSLLHRNVVLKLCELEKNKVPANFSQLFLSRAVDLVAVLVTRQIPLYHQEILDIKKECQRLLDLYRLLLLKRESRPKAIQDLIQPAFNATLAIVDTPAPYSDSVRGDYFESLTDIVKLPEPLRLCPDFCDGGDDEKVKFLSYKKILT